MTCAHDIDHNENSSTGQCYNPLQNYCPSKELIVQKKKKAWFYNFAQIISVKLLIVMSVSQLPKCSQQTAGVVTQALQTLSRSRSPDY